MFCSVEVRSPSSAPRYCHQGVSCTAYCFCWCFYLSPRAMARVWVSITENGSFSGTHKQILAGGGEAGGGGAGLAAQPVPRREERLVLLTSAEAGGEPGAERGPSVVGELQDGRDAVSASVWCSARRQVGRAKSSRSRCSLCTQPEIKARLARAGAGSSPWQMPFVLSS